MQAEPSEQFAYLNHFLACKISAHRSQQKLVSQGLQEEGKGSWAGPEPALPFCPLQLLFHRHMSHAEADQALAMEIGHCVGGGASSVGLQGALLLRDGSRPYQECYQGHIRPLGQLRFLDLRTAKQKISISNASLMFLYVHKSRS